MSSVSATNTAPAALGQLRPVNTLPKYGHKASGKLCAIRPRKQSACSRTCAVVLGSVLGGLAVIALLVLLLCCLAVRRRRKRLQNMEASRTMKAIGEGEGSAFVSESQLVLSGCEMSTRNPVAARERNPPVSSVFASANSYAPRVTQNLPLAGPQVGTLLDGLVLGSRGNPQASATRAATGQSPVSVRVPHILLNSTTTDGTQRNGPSVSLSRRRRVIKCAKSDMSVCPSNSSSSIEDDLAQP